MSFKFAHESWKKIWHYFGMEWVTKIASNMETVPSSLKSTWLIMILWVSISNLVSSWTNLSVSYRERNSGMQTQIKVVMSCQKWKETKSSNSGTWEQWQGFIFCLLSAEVTTSRRKYYRQKVWLLSKQLAANSNPLNDNGDQAGNISIIFLGNWAYTDWYFRAFTWSFGRMMMASYYICPIASILFPSWVCPNNYSCISKFRL